MAQRVSAVSAAAPAFGEVTATYAQGQQQQVGQKFVDFIAEFRWKSVQLTFSLLSLSHQHPEELHTMPNALRRIPEWYQASTFQYNARLIVGVAPGLFLLLTVTGKP